MKSFFLEDRGAVIIIVGLLFLACIGFAVLTIDVSLWYSDQRTLQNHADAGAIGGAMALKTKGNAFVTAEATHDLNLTGCTSSNNCTIVAINTPPVSGPNVGNNQAVEVILSQPGALYLGSLFLSSAPTLSARSVAGILSSNNCITTLGTTGIGLDVKGGGSVNSPNCGIYTNSSASNAINVAGTASILIDTINVVGGINTNGGGSVTTPHGTNTGVNPVADPYSSLSVPVSSGCTQTNYSTKDTVTINPGVYCGGIKLTSKANVTMNPGTYVVQGDFDASGQSTITGTGVTIIMTQGGSLKWNAGLVANLSAPTTVGDPFKGILFYGDRNFPGITNKVNGGAAQILDGVAYFPTSSLDYAGQAASSTNNCLRLVAKDITLTGGAALGNGCNANNGGGSIALLE